MAKIIFGQAFTANVTTTTAYFSIGQGGGRTSTTEANQAIVHRSAGTYSNFYMRITFNDRGATSTARVRKNTANGNQTFTVATSTTGEFEDTSNTDTVASGDALCYSLVGGAGGTGITPGIAMILFDASSNTVERFCGSNSTSSTNSTSYAGIGSGNITENNTTLKIKAAGTLTNMLAKYSANSRSTTTTINNRINAANGNLVLAFATTVTGDIEDTSNTDNVSVNDLACMKVTLTTGTGSLTAQYTAIDFTSTAYNFHFLSSSPVTALTELASGSILYPPISGDMGVDTGDPTEADTSLKVKLAVTGSNVGVRVSANTVTAASSATLRKNGSNANQSASVTGLTTGYFEDASNTDSLISGDEINYGFLAGAGGTSVSFRIMQMLGTVSAPVPAFFTPLIKNVNQAVNRAGTY